MRYTEDGAIPDGTELTVLRLATVSQATTNVLFVEIRLVRETATNWKLWMYNEQDDLVWGANLNLYNHNRWWYVSLGNNNDSLEQSLRLFAFDTVDTTITLLASEPWDFDALNLRLFANDPLSLEFFSGTIGKIDFITGMYDLNDNKYKNFDRGLPNLIYLIDFTDPEYTQYFANRITGSGYADGIRGKHNHTDSADLPFNPVNEFSQRHWIHHISLPFFRDREFTRQNMIYHMKFRGWGLNHWSRGSEWYFGFGRWTAGGGERHRYAVYKVDYSTRLRVYIRYGHHRHICNYNVEPNFPAHEAYT